MNRCMVCGNRIDRLEYGYRCKQCLVVVGLSMAGDLTERFAYKRRGKRMVRVPKGSLLVMSWEAA